MLVHNFYIFILFYPPQNIFFMRTSALESVQDFLIKLDIKPLIHLLEMSTFSLNNVIVKLIKIMKNQAHFQ